MRKSVSPWDDVSVWPQNENYVYTMNFVMAKIILLLDIGIPNLAQGCIPMRQHVVYIHDLCMTLTFDLYVVTRVSLVSFTHSFYFVHIDFIEINLKHSFQLKILDP